jgi:hypothetical protein
MRAKILKISDDGSRLKFHPGNKPEKWADVIEQWKCPHCLKPTKRAKCLASVVQWGFSFDDHVDYFRCNCGWLYYAHYLVFTGEEIDENGTISA